MKVLVLLASLTFAKAVWEAPEDHPVLEFLQFVGGDKEVQDELVDRLPAAAAGYVLEAAQDRRRNPEPYSVACDGCLLLADTLNGMVAMGLEWADIRQDMLDFCTNLLGILDERAPIMCPGVVDLQVKHVYTVFRNRTVESEYACRTINFCLERDLNPQPKTKVVNKREAPQRVSTNRAVSKADLQNALKLVQLTDIHVDEEYSTGAATDCGLPVCCRNYWPGEGNAGHWGTYSCNTPVRTIESFLQQIRSLGPDIVIYSGDNPPHSLWNETFESQVRNSQTVVNLLTSNLPGVRTYGSIGNHELYPTNLYYMGLRETVRFNDAFSQMWYDAAGLTPEQIDTIQRGGYYSMLIRPGLRLIVYNSDFGYNMNWYVIWSQNEREYTSMKDWVQEQLQQARSRNEKVILLGHHPTGSSTINDFSVWLSNMALQFGDDIILNMFGHTHTDRFILVRTPGSGIAQNVQFVAPSITTMPHNNPSARVYYLDRNSFQVLDYEQYFMNLTAANEHGPGAQPQVELTYGARAEYGLPDMSPASWQQLVQRFETDDALFQRWYNNQRGRPERSTCTGECKSRALCSMRETTYENYVRCTEGSTP